MQVLWFDTTEVAILIMSYMLATTLGGLGWAFLFVVGPFFISVKRSKPRGWINHYVYANGFMDIKAYPLPTQNRFYE